MSLLNYACGGDEFPSDLVSMIEARLAGLVPVYNDVDELLHCSELNSAYTTLFYDGFCYNAVNGFFLILFAQMAIAFFTLMMVTLRVSWQQLETEEVAVNQGNKNSSGYEQVKTQDDDSISFIIKP
eukprot:CAMPEP_0172516160 /NCGR_PEP_ID=MMETSP1066-20121228/273857_1 /TAXON_ID=671091 /ORGANISM="Coscinodiscus wailesii, Strain CCMP2513" /LENGTH=125 /DNA_ID=CAMNT_0013297519 /DNA_START=343 /DNA_END=716 /DNA_ORIENTATION=+